MWSSARKWQIGIAATLFLLSIFVMQDQNDLLSNGASDNNGNTQRGDYYLRGTTMTLTNPEGAAIYQLQAERMDYYPKFEHSELSALSLDYFANETSTGQTNIDHWQFTATKGFLPNGGVVVELSDGVIAQQILTESSQTSLQPLVFKTEKLDIYLQDDTAVSPVSTITRGDNQFTTDELRLYLNEGLLELDGQVRAHYEP